MLLKIIIEIVLTLLVMFIGSIYWSFLQAPSILERWIGDGEKVSISMEAFKKSGKGFRVTFEGNHLVPKKSEEFETMLTSCNFNVFRAWKVAKWSVFLGVIVIFFGSFLLHWPYLLVNLLVFLFVYVFGSVVAKGVVGKHVALLAQIIQQWLLTDSAGCEKFCTETNPRFATVFRVVSTTGREAAI